MNDNFNKATQNQNQKENNFKTDKKYNKIVYKISDVSSKLILKILSIKNFYFHNLFDLTKIGQEEGYPVLELLNHTPYSRGWQSSRFCEYPQEIILEFGQKVKVKQIQFLSHQYKITTKIELMIFNPGQTKKFKKIGYLALDSNERSNYQARELKSVYLDHDCLKIKIVLNKCHSNTHNIFNQVGLISINVLGEYTNKINENPHLDENNLDAKVPDTFEDNIRYDPITLNKLKSLNSMKDKAISEEDYDTAQNIKNAISRLKSVSNQLMILEERKQIAIKNDEFDQAKLLKVEIENLRDEVSKLDYNNKKPMNKINQENNDRNNPENNNRNKNQNNFNEENNFENNLENKKELERQNSNKGGRTPSSKNNQTKNKFDMNENINNINNQENEPRNNLSSPPSNNKNRTNTKFPIDNKRPINNNNNEKGPIDVDNIVIKGNNNQDFDDLVTEKMKKEGKGSKTQEDNLPVDEDDIPEKEYPIAEPLISVFTYDLVKMLFSKNWKNKEEGLKMIKNEILKYPKSNIINAPPEKIIIAALAAAEYIFSATNPQSSIAAMELLKNVLIKFQNENPNSFGYGKQDFVNKVEKCMGLILEKTGDSNQKLREKAENTINDFADSPLIGDKTVLDYLIKGKVKKSLANSPKNLISRLNLINRNIELFGVNDLDIDSLVNFAILNFKNPNKDVRDTSYNLLMNIYKYIGDEVKKYFKDLRPPQVSALEEGFDGVEVISIPKVGRALNSNLINIKNINNENNNNQKTNKPSQGNNEVNSNSNKIIKGKDEKKKSISKNLNEENEEIEKIKNNQNENNENKNQTTCSFCGYFDEKLDEDTLALHLYKNCPWLSSCFKCKQTVEIHSLNIHYMNECNSKKDFKICTRCKEPITSNLYDKHVNDKSCIPGKNPNIANRCPLCHKDITPSGEEGWNIHLLQEGCPNNPRKGY